MKPSRQKTVAATPLRRVPVLSETQVRNLVGVGSNGLLFKPGTFVRPAGK